MSDADLLRRAAALMRERAGAATAGPWRVEDGEHVRTCDQYGLIEVWNRYEAEHIASWHPAIALAVADWLDGFADETDALNNHASDCRPCAPALAVARAYLGEPTDGATA